MLYITGFLKLIDATTFLYAQVLINLLTARLLGIGKRESARLGAIHLQNN